MFRLVDIAAVIRIAMAVLGLAGLATSLFAFSRVAAIKGSLEAVKATLETVSLGNAELRRTNDDLRAELATERKERDAERATASAKLARLEGQMELLTGHLGEQIAAAVIRALPSGSLPHTDPTRG